MSPRNIKGKSNEISQLENLQPRRHELELKNVSQIISSYLLRTYTCPSKHENINNDKIKVYYPSCFNLRGTRYIWEPTEKKKREGAR